MKYLLGSQLSPALQAECKRTFVHRFTAEHLPAWSRAEWKDGKPYPLQFASDADWLANTEFPITSTGRLARGANVHCISHPTWPENPELRKVT